MLPTLNGIFLTGNCDEAHLRLKSAWGAFSIGGSTCCGRVQFGRLPFICFKALFWRGAGMTLGAGEVGILGINMNEIVAL